MSMRCCVGLLYFARDCELGALVLLTLHPAVSLCMMQVQAFYAAMGQLMGQKLEKMGGIQGPAGQPQQGQRPPPANRLP